MTFRMSDVVGIGAATIRPVASYQIAGSPAWTGGGGSTPVAPANTTAPAITGAATVGSTLSHSGDVWTGSPAPTFAYRWQRSTDAGATWATISGAAAATYASGTADAGNSVRMQKQGSNASGTTAWITSTNTISVTASAAVAPANTTAPQVTSTATIPGSVLTASGAVWTGTPDPTISTRWRASTDGGTTWVAAASSSNSLTYTIPAGTADGVQFRPDQMATNGLGNTTWIPASNAITVGTAAQAPTQTGTPTISGTAQVGETLTFAPGAWTASPAITHYQYSTRSRVPAGAWSAWSGWSASTTMAVGAIEGQNLQVRDRASNDNQATWVTGGTTSAEFGPMAAAGGGSLRAGTVADPGVGIYLNWNRDTEVHGSPFIDHLKLGGGWRSSGGGNLNWNQLLAAGHIDAEGRAISKPAGADNLLFQALFAMPAASDGTRTYRLFYEGNITNGWVAGSAENQTTGSAGGVNYIDFDYTANGSNDASLLVDSWTGTIRLRGLVRHDDLADYAAGHTFRRPWLEMIRNTRMLRFVDWMNTEYYEGSGVWADRYTPARATYQGGEGVPVEVMCELCNLIGADPWFSLVSNANDNYVTQFMTVALNSLDAKRHPYLELSSKAWDGANYATAEYFRDMAVSLFSSASIEASMEAYGGRSSQVFQLARSVWSGANLPRLHTMIQGWTPNTSISYRALAAPGWVALGGGRVAPWTVTTDYAIHANLDGGMRYPGTSSLAPLDSLIAANGNNSQTVFDYMADQMRTGGGYSISGNASNYAEQKTMIADYGSPNVICYEGGSHLCVPPERTGNANWVQTFNNYHASQTWADVWQDNVENWYDAFGPSNTFVFKSDIRKPDQNNGYGVLRWSGDTVGNPRLTMFNNNVNTRVGDGTRAASDFVGAFDTTDGYDA